MRVLVTRPEEDARTLVSALAARGHEVLVEPMLTIATAPGVAPPLDLGDAQALLFTSANGVRAFARLSEVRGLPVFAVGDTSAAAARAAGFVTVESAGGDVSDLARLVNARLDHADGPLYHAAASQVAGDLTGDLEAAGFTLRREVLYEATPVTDLSAGLRRALNQGELNVATFYSPRTAETFTGLIRTLDLADSCKNVTALGLSAAVAAKLRDLPWREVLVAEQPNQDALLARLDAVAADAVPAAVDETAGEDVGLSGAQGVIARFGGIRPMASKLGVAVSTVQGWRERGVIPARHHQRILNAAREHDIAVREADLAIDEPPSAAVTAPKPAPKPAPEPARAPKASAATRATATPRPAAVAPPEPSARPERPAAAPPQRAAHARAASGAWLRGVVVGGLVFLAGAGGMLLTRSLWMPLADSEYGVLDGGQLMSVERRIAALESAQASAQPAPGDGGGAEAMQALESSLGALDGRLRDLQARIETLASTPAPDDAAGAARLAEVSARLDELSGLEDRVAALSEVTERLGQVEDLAGRLDALAQQVARLAALEARIDELSAAVQGLDEIPELKGQIAELAGAQGQARAAFTGDAAFAVAVLQLRDALRGSGPFAAELGLLQDLVASGAIEDGERIGQAIAPLAGHAATGIPGLAMLKARFPAVARAVVVEARAGAAEGWLAGVVRRVSDLASWRRVGPVEGTDPEAVVARAEAALMNDDLAGALAELEALQGPPAAAAQTWRDQAAARREAQGALTELGRVLLARITPAGG